MRLLCSKKEIDDNGWMPSIEARFADKPERLKAIKNALPSDKFVFDIDEIEAMRWIVKKPGRPDDNFAAVRWSCDDIIESYRMRGRDITVSQARQFLEKTERYIVDVMITAGWESISCLISEDRFLPMSEEELVEEEKMNER